MSRYDYGRRCHCHGGIDSDFGKLFWQGMAYAMTTHSSIFRKTIHHKFIFEWDSVEEKYVVIPKQYADNYDEKRIEYFKKCIALIDQGYSNGRFTSEVIERARNEIVKHQIVKGEVLE